MAIEPNFVADKEDNDSVDEQWVDDVVARALERSIENAPEFLPNDIENSVHGKPLGSIDSSKEEDANIDSLADKSSPMLSSDSPYPDDTFLHSGTEIEEGEQKKKTMKSFLESERKRFGKQIRPNGPQVEIYPSKYPYTQNLVPHLAPDSGPLGCEGL